MRIDLVTLFPGFFSEVLDTSILGRAIADGHLEVAVHDLRKYASDRHGTVDDAPFGGGGGSNCSTTGGSNPLSGLLFLFALMGLAVIRKVHA